MKIADRAVRDSFIARSCELTFGISRSIERIYRALPQAKTARRAARREFEFLRGAARQVTTTLCGRNAVQIARSGRSKA